MSKNVRLDPTFPDAQLRMQEQVFGDVHPPLCDNDVAEVPPRFVHMSSSADPSCERNVPSVGDSVADDEPHPKSNSYLHSFFHSLVSRHRSNKKHPATERTSLEEGASVNGERIPLLMVESAMGIDDCNISSNLSFSEKRKSEEACNKAVLIASIFLNDYQQARPPTLRSTSDASRASLFIHNCRDSYLWKISKVLVVCSFFFASCLEGDGSVFLPFTLNFFAIILLSADILMQRKLNLSNGKWTLPTLLMMAALSVEMLLVISFPWLRRRFIISSIAKPIVLFHCSDKARHALEAVGTILPVVSRVLALELLLILSFAAVACRLFAKFESFRDLATAWVSLFQLSTTVVNPSLWMPIYNESKQAASFFVLFLITMALYLHSLVLSVVFSAFIQASTTIYERSLSDREETLRLAFASLQGPSGTDSAVQMVETRYIRRTLQILRPHYNAMKVDTLIGIVDSAHRNAIDYNTFRTTVPQALSATVRSAPSRPNLYSYIIESVGAVVAISNFVFVILLSSQGQATWFDGITLPVGFTITMLGFMELLARTNPCVPFRFTPTTKLNFIFDGLAALAVAVSCWGILRREIAVELMLTGRAIDMIRIMRFQRIFRDVIRRSSEVLPALGGPLALVISTHHVLVYIGMSMWGGAITVGTYGDLISPLYDLNNFNSYSEGLVTMFQILIVNDWHAIAAVFLQATKFQHPFFVYSFFIFANLASVSVMLNCLVAFFVGAFVAKIDGSSIGIQAAPALTQQNKVSFSTDATSQLSRIPIVTRNGSAFSGDSSHSSNACPSDVLEFHVLEREGFGNIMRTVAGGTGTTDADAYAKQVCDMLDLLERLSPGRPKLGYLIYRHQAMGTYGNIHFRALAESFLNADQLHAIVTDMHKALLSNQGDEGIIHREFTRDGSILQLAASLLRQQPPISLFVSVVATR